MYTTASGPENRRNTPRYRFARTDQPDRAATQSPRALRSNGLQISGEGAAQSLPRYCEACQPSAAAFACYAGALDTGTQLVQYPCTYYRSARWP